MKTTGKPAVKRTYTGIVTSDKMDKTIVVKTERTFVQKELSKTLRTTKNYKVHCEEQARPKVGDLVEFVEGRPVSKTKYMYLTRVIKPAAAQE
jgi:small subunit ribosomal protein S17